MSMTSSHCVIVLGCLLAATARCEPPTCVPSGTDTAWQAINHGNLPADTAKAMKATTVAEAITSIGSPYSKKKLAGSETAWWLYGTQRKYIQNDCVKPTDITYTTEFYLLSVSRVRNHLSCKIHHRPYMTATSNPNPFAKKGSMGFAVSRSTCSNWLNDSLRQHQAN